MAAVTATVSTFSWNSVVIDAIGTVSVSAARPALDVTQIGSANTHHVPGVATTVVAADLYMNATDHQALVNDYLSATARAFVITVATGQTITGTGIITGCDVVSSNQDVVRGSIAIQVSGPVTIFGSTAVSGSNEI